MTTEKELLVLNKLEYLKEVRFRMQEMERLRSSIAEELDLINVEERCLQEYRREMESLCQEKMTHVEELRQIHSDINMLENVLKQSEEDRNRHAENVKRLHLHLQQMKDTIEKMRTEIGLPRLADKEADDPLDKISAELDKRTYSKSDSSYQLDSRVSNLDPLVVGKTLNVTSTKPFNDNTNTTAAGSNAASVAPPPSTPSSAGYASSLASLVGFQEKHQPSSYQRLLMNSATGGAGQAATASLFHHHHHHQQSQQQPNHHHVHQEPSQTTSPAAFRQQPPPMKSCLSCHQQIHRNAPICPLCKAKSRSRHPKRRNNPKN